MFLLNPFVFSQTQSGYPLDPAKVKLLLHFYGNFNDSSPNNHAMTLTEVRANLNTAQTSGSVFTVDINENGSSILSTKLTIDNTEKTSTTAATAPVISDGNLADDAEITIDIDQVGNGTAKGLKLTLIGTRA